MAYSITKSRVVSILAKKKISKENLSCDSISEMPKSQLREFLNERIGARPKFTATEVAQKGGIAESYISHLKSGTKDPMNMTVDAILRLAKGMKESPVALFQAAIGKHKTGLSDASLQQILEDFSQLDSKSRGEMEFVIDQLRRMVAERLDRDT